jgi:rare lipoprotein A
MLFKKQILTMIIACGTIATPIDAQAISVSSFIDSPIKQKTEWEIKFEQKMPTYTVPLASAYRGNASWYGYPFYGNQTANGEIYRPGTMTAAHPSLPFGTRVKVTNLNNGRSTVVRINDRGPYVGGRIIDLSETAAESIDMKSSGVAPVKIQILN